MPIYKTGKSKNGLQQYRVVVSYKTLGGEYKKIERTAYGSAEAKDLERQLTAETKKAPAQRLTVQELYDEYIEAKKYEVRETTFVKIVQNLKGFVLPYLNTKRIDALTPSVLQKWKNQISEADIATRTKQNVYSVFRAMLNYAVKMDYIPKNPILKVGNFKEAYFETKEEKLQYYTPEQFKKYISCALQNCRSLSDYNFYVFFSIAYYTGARKGEINALKWSDVEGNVLHIRRSIHQKLKGEDRETPPKNKSSYRDIQIPVPLLEILQEQKERQMLSDRFTEDWRICGGEQCLRDTTIDKKNRDFADAADLPRIRIHDFRHSHASLLANEGINIQEIARRLGHSEIEMTWNTYSHLYPREEERALQILNKIRG